MDKQQLKPCPFCGELANIVAVGRDWWRLKVDHTDECFFGDGHDRDAPQTDDGYAWLVESWNGRAPQPPSASDERERFEAWNLAGCEMVDDPGSSRMDIARHCAWAAWQARAALAPSPGVDAAEQKPVAWIEHHKGGDNLVWDDPGGKRTALYAAPSPAASADEWMAEAVRLVDAFSLASERAGRLEIPLATYGEHRKALLAHLKARP